MIRGSAADKQHVPQTLRGTHLFVGHRGVERDGRAFFYATSFEDVPIAAQHYKNVLARDNTPEK